MKNRQQLASCLGIPEEALIQYGRDKYKIDEEVIKQRYSKAEYETEPKGKVVLVTAITPTKSGEGKTTTVISLTDSINKYVGHTYAIACLREPSLGPVWGMKGGATGALKASLYPEEDINLHFNGDIHAITATVNLIASVIENHIYQGNELNLDPDKIEWKRAVDINDRSLKNIRVNVNLKNGHEHNSQFVITAASELMSIFCLAKDKDDLIDRINNILVGYTFEDKPVYLKDLHISKACWKMLKDAFMPNLAQTLEGSPAIIHGGPFANISIGTNSKIATRLATALAPLVITEAGFGAQLGAEKYLDIVSKDWIKPEICVLVATAKALKKDGERTLEEGLKQDLQKHYNNLSRSGIKVIVALNLFVNDKQEDINMICDYCSKHNITCEVIDVSQKNGAIALAKQVIKASAISYTAKALYDNTGTFKQRLEALCSTVYGCQVELSEEAENKLKRAEKYGWDNFDICVAKTQYSWCDDPKKETGKIHVRDIWIYTGARLIVPICGPILLMPGLSKEPRCLDWNN